MSEDPRLRVLIVDDDEDDRLLLLKGLASQGIEADQARDGIEAMEALERGSFDVLLLDLVMPRMDGSAVLAELENLVDRPEVVVVTGRGSVASAVDAMKRGAFDYLTKPCPPDILARRVERAGERHRLARANGRMREEALRRRALPDVITADPDMLDVLAMAARAAARTDPVAVVGEPGTGRELVARTIHSLTGLSDGGFAVLRCAHGPRDRLPGELFGRTARADLRPSLGLVDLAQDGVLLLRDMDALPEEDQRSVLSLMESGRFRRVGGGRDHHARCRIMATFRAPPRGLAEEGLLLTDLADRFSSTVLRLPPLRDRHGDPERIAEYLVATLPGGGRSRSLSPEALRVLGRGEWPGNVTELRAVLERALSVSRNDVLGPDDLDLSERGPDETGWSRVPDSLDSMRNVEAWHLARALDAHRWHRGRTADTLEISARTLYRKIREFELRRGDDG
jgi:DNA-binding NtrC family response regulator